MSDELEAFLRRAAQKRQKRRPAEIVLIDPSDEPVIAEPVHVPPRQSSRPPRSRGELAPPSPVVIPPKRPHLRHSEGAGSGELPSRVGTSDVTQVDHATRLSDHQLGRLQRSAESQAVDHADDLPSGQRSGLAMEILELLQTQDGARRAILLNEILTPPVHRWE
jgi:hypothetical protein